MDRKNIHKTTTRPLPRSVLSSLHEPLLDPKDGHGARSKRDVIIMQKWEAAKKGDDNALAYLLKLIVNENLAELKAARGTERLIRIGGGEVKMRSLAPVMTLLRMITVETVAVPGERDGFVEVTQRKRILLEDWFEHYALGHEEANPEVVDEVRNWMARGSIQRPDRGECLD